MAKRGRRIVEIEETAYFVVYDRRTGAVLALHHVNALPGVRAPAEEVITRRVRKCAAEALGRRLADLGVLRTPDLPRSSPRLRVDLATGTLRTDRRASGEGKKPLKEVSRPGGTVAPAHTTRDTAVLKSQFPSP